MNLLDLGGVAGVREGLEDLHVDVAVGGDLDLNPVVHAGDDLLSDLDGSEVLKGVSRGLLDLVSEGDDEGELLFGELRLFVPTTCKGHLMFKEDL